LTPTLTALAIGNPIRVSGWISIPENASTIKQGRFFAGGLNRGVLHATNCVLNSVFHACRATDYLLKKLKKSLHYKWFHRIKQVEHHLHPWVESGIRIKKDIDMFITYARVFQVPPLPKRLSPHKQMNRS
jgi:hypothetical protein